MKIVRTAEGNIIIGDIEKLSRSANISVYKDFMSDFFSNTHMRIINKGTNLLNNLEFGETLREYHLINGKTIKITMSTWNATNKTFSMGVTLPNFTSYSSNMSYAELPNGLQDIYFGLHDISSNSAYLANGGNYAIIKHDTSGHGLYHFEYNSLSTNFDTMIQGATIDRFGEDSTTGGGFGEWDISSDVIDFPNLPTGSALETGLINMYKCDTTDLHDFGDYLWGDNFFNQISKIFNDPMESFVSLNLFPVTPAASTTKTPIKIGNLSASKSASEYVTAYPLTSQYLEFDCGTVNINEFFGSALDYNPYTQVQIYLPFIGFQNLSVDDIMDGTITLKYHIDLLTGTCTALIKCEKSNKYNLASVLYSFAGSMNMTVPISASNYSAALGTMINAITGIGIGAAMGGAPAMLGVSATGSAMNIMNTKATVQRSGGIAMNAGALGNLTPYIIITRPVQHKPEDYQKFKGWENNITYTLSALQGKGYTEIMYTHIEGLTATDEEKTEIESLLKDGVIL